MKGLQKFLSLIAVFVLVLCFSACDSQGGWLPSNGGAPGGSNVGQGENNLKNEQDYSGENDKIADFTLGLSNIFNASNGWSNGGMFDCTWQASNVFFGKETKSLHISLTQKKNTIYAGEYRTYQAYGYGYYSAKMKPIARSGVISSFFTYRGMGGAYEWHEIDIEFLGKDTTKVQFNYFTNGVGGHEYLYDLGFDASKGFHEYGFRWEKDCIVWYVDGKPVYKASDNIPYKNMQIMINAWPIKSDVSNPDWAGTFDKNFPVSDAEYLWISFKSIN